jgi:hypothetical protein
MQLQRQQSIIKNQVKTTPQVNKNVYRSVKNKQKDYSLPMDQ